MPAKGQGCIRVRRPRGGNLPYPSSAQALPAPGRRCCSRRPASAVTLHERSDAAMMQSTSHWAGGMLAPWCESESAEPVISRLGLRSLDLWREQLPDTPFNGSLVVAHSRDRADFERFAKIDLRPPAARRQGARRTRAVARRTLSRRAVLCRRRPCRAAPRAAETARAHHRRRRHHPVQQRASRLPTSTAS